MSDTLLCTNCAAPNRDNSRYCISCGEKLPIIPPGTYPSQDEAQSELVLKKFGDDWTITNLPLFDQEISQGALGGAPELAKLQQKINETRQIFESFQSNPDQFSQEEMKDMIDTGVKKVSEIQATTDHLRPRLIMPPQEQLNVRLVTSHSLERLDEYRTDENRYYMLMGLFGGAFLGLLLDLANKPNLESVTTQTWILLVLFILFSAFCGLMIKITSDRSKKVKDQIFHV